MAKGIRNNWKRKMNAIKRTRYAVKERAQLENMLKKAADEAKAQEADPTYAPLFKLVEFKKKEEDEKEGAEEMDTDKEVRKIDPKTKRDQFGNFAPWMNRKQIAQMKNKISKAKKDKKKSKKRK